MVQKLRKSWWPLVVCGLFYAAISATYLFMQQQDGPVTFHSWKSGVMLLGRLATAAGACTIAASFLKYTGNTRWCLVLNGLALSALGLIYLYLVGFRIRFLTIALLIIMMAVSTCVLELRIAWRLRQAAGRWLFSVAGAVFVGVALVFLALGVGWIKLGPGSRVDILWLAAYFGFSAVCTLGSSSLASQI